jgi:pimeloyl-ACP methyl ester carboxylesterase
VLVITGASMSANGASVLDRVFDNISARRWRAAYREMFGIGSASTLSRTLMGTLAWAIGPRLVPPPDDPTIILSELAAWRTFDGAAIAASIQCPTLVIGTDRDPVFGPTYATDLAALIPGSQAVVIPGLAHAFPPTAIEEHISPFLG